MYCKRILCPIDFGPTSAAALTYGIDMGRLCGAEIHLLHVVDGSAGAREFLVPSPSGCDAAATGELMALVSVGDRQDLQLAFETRTGAPADEILDYAAEHGIDLIVMGTHGREGMARLLVGSVAETIVRKATCRC